MLAIWLINHSCAFGNSLERAKRFFNTGLNASRSHTLSDKARYLIFFSMSLKFKASLSHISSYLRETMHITIFPILIKALTRHIHHSNKAFIYVTHHCMYFTLNICILLKVRHSIKVLICITQPKLICTWLYLDVFL